MTDHTTAPKIIQDILAAPYLSVQLAEYCKVNGISKESASVVLEYVEDFLCGTLDLADCTEKLRFECSASDQNIEQIMIIVGHVVGEEGMDVVLHYPINKVFAPENTILTPVQNATVPVLSPLQPVARTDNRSIRDRLFDALSPFELHIDEQAVVTKEVERYVKGETRAVDVSAHIAAMIDKPVSTVSKIIDSLNVHIFIPLKKQIVEEKAHDLHSSDEALTAALLGKPLKKERGPLSFVPQDLMRSTEQKRKEDIFSDLRSVGGTPSGTSLLSQEIKKEQKINVSDATQKSDSIQIMPKKSYSVDPYREIM